MSEHAAFGASGASRYMACAASYRMTKDLPAGRSTRAALVGTACHDIIARCLDSGGKLGAAAFLGKMWEVEEEGQVAEIEITQELVDAMQFCIEYADRRSVNALYRVVEQKFTLNELQPPAPMFGTSDFGSVVAWEPDVYETVDWKLGVGVEVVAAKNPQGRFYNLGGYIALPPAVRRTIRRVRTTIVQPRLAKGPAVTHEELTVIELLEWAEELLAAVRKALEPDAPFTPGESQCRFCPAAANCPGLKDFAAATVKDAFKANPPDLPVPSLLSDEEAGELLQRASLVRLWLDRLQQDVVGRLATGRVVPGWKLVHGQTRRVWAQGEDATTKALLGLGLDFEDLMDSKLRSPAQVEKLMAKKDQAQLASLVTRSTPSTALASADDPRPAISAGAGMFPDNPYTEEEA